MHKRRVATTLLIAGTFSTGFVITQIAGATPSFAATKKHVTTKTHVTSKKHTTGTATKKVAGSGAHKHAAGSATPHADGTIAAVNGDTITVKADTDPSGSTEYTGVTTIVLNSSTKYEAGKGTTATTKPTFTVGQNIVAEGTVSSDGKTLTATLVGVHAAGGGHGGHGHGGGGPHADGTVTAVNGDNISIKADSDPAGSSEYTNVTTIVLTGTTQYDAGKGNASTTKPTITTGNYISAEGTLSSDGKTLTATRVDVHSSAPGGH